MEKKWLSVAGLWLALIALVFIIRIEMNTRGVMRVTSWGRL